MSKKLKKELRDQSLHFLWASSTAVLPFVAYRVYMPPWTALLLLVAAGASLTLLVGREIWQKRDKPGGILYHWPWLDSGFYALGAVVGVVVGVFAV